MIEATTSKPAREGHGGIRADNFRNAPLSDLMTMAGQLDSALNLPERNETDFVTHADWRNYLYGRRGG